MPTYAAIPGGLRNWYDRTSWSNKQVPPNPIPANDVIEIPQGVSVSLQHQNAGREQENEGTINVDGSLRNFDQLTNSGSINVSGGFTNILAA